MKKIVLIGGGGHCKSVLDTLLRCGTYEDIVLVDPAATPGSKIMGCRVAGGDEVLEDLLLQGYSRAFIAVGSIKSTALRRTLYEKCTAMGFEMVNIVDPSACVSPFCTLGRGIFVGKGAVLNSDCAVMDMAIINTRGVIEHECRVGAFTHVSVGAVLCGQVHVGEDCFVGANATILQGVHLGDRVIVGAGSTVLSSAASDQTLVGVYRGK